MKTWIKRPLSERSLWRAAVETMSKNIAVKVVIKGASIVLGCSVGKRCLTVKR